MSGPIIEPIHTATIAGKPLRFFRSPNDKTRGGDFHNPEFDGWPDLPWHSANDLALCVNLSNDLRNSHLRRLAEYKPRTVTRRGKIIELPHTLTVATKDDITLIAPDHWAEPLFNSEDAEGEVHEDLDLLQAYHAGLRAAIEKVTTGLSPYDLCRWLKAACERYDDAWVYLEPRHCIERLASESDFLAMVHHNNDSHRLEGNGPYVLMVYRGPVEGGCYRELTIQRYPTLPEMFERKCAIEEADYTCRCVAILLFSPVKAKVAS